MENQYTKLLEDLDNGDLAVELNEAIAEVVQAVLNTGNKGSLALVLNIERKRHGQIKISPKVTPKVPREEAQVSLRYVTPAGQLVEQDPNQKEFAFKGVAEFKPAEEAASGE